MIRGIKAIKRQIILPSVLNREDLPVPLPLVRLNFQPSSPVGFRVIPPIESREVAFS
jgi:hypothetical protein